MYKVCWMGKNTPEGCSETHKSSFLHINKKVGEMVMTNDLKRPMLSYYVIYYEKFRKIMQQTEKEVLTVSKHTFKDSIL